MGKRYLTWIKGSNTIVIEKIIIKEGKHMDVEQMKADLGPGAIFDIGEENTAFAQYFTGECYLKMLTTEGVGIGNVSFAPKTKQLRT